METTVTMKIEATFIGRDTGEGWLPMNAENEKDLAERVKAALGADDILVKDVKHFELEDRE